jgi:hypothetical protein
MAVTVQDILNAAFPAYAATHRLPLHVHRAVSVLRRCRTGGLGPNAVKCTAGVGAGGNWRASGPQFLVWGPVLRTVFRGKLLAALGQRLAQGQRQLPPALTVAAVRALLEQCARHEWHVRIEPPYLHGRGRVVYLARYLRGGPIKNHRLVEFTGTALASRQFPQKPMGPELVVSHTPVASRRFPQKPMGPGPPVLALSN